MTSSNDPISQPLHEAIYSPGETDLSSLAPDERARWTETRGEVEAIREALADVSMPARLTERLLAIPQSKPVPRWRRAAKVQLGWKTIAASVVIAVTLSVAYVYWPQRPVAVRPSAPPLDSSLAQRIAQSTVVAFHQPMQVESGESTRVLDLFRSKPLPFSPLLPSPLRPGVTLLGGGTTTVNGTPAVFTRWQSDDAQITLVEISSATFHLPATYQQTTVTIGHTTAIIHPGDATTAWVLFSEPPDTCGGWMFCE